MVSEIILKPRLKEANFNDVVFKDMLGPLEIRKSIKDIKSKGLHISMSPYSVTKAAVISLSETLRMEAAPFNIHITVACPMFFNTGLLDDMKTTDPWIAEVAKTAFLVGHSAEVMAKKLIKAVEQDKLFVVPMIYGKLLWLNKRLTPNLYYNLSAWLNRHGWLKPMYLKLARWGVLSK